MPRRSSSSRSRKWPRYIALVTVMTLALCADLVLIISFSMHFHHWLTTHWMELPSWSTPAGMRTVATGHRQSLITTIIFDCLAVLLSQAVLERVYWNLRFFLRLG